MRCDVYRYTFAPEVQIEEAEATFLLSVLAVEAVHGESQARLDSAHAFDAAARACVIDASTAVGRDLNKLFVGFLQREFGADAFRVDRVANEPVTSAAAPVT